MLFTQKQFFVFLSKKIRSLTGFVEKIILFVLSLTLALLLLINGGVDPDKHAFIVPFFGILIFLHGLYVYLWNKSKRRVGDYQLSAFPFKFLPFLVWALFSGNFISPVPWLGQMYLIYFFEAFIVMWIIANHVKNLKQFGVIFIGLSIPFLVHLYLGFDQFFHGRSFGPLGLKKIVSGLFYESNSYVFLISVVFAGIFPTLILRYWRKAKRFILWLLFLLLALSVVMANNFQGFLMLGFACMSCSYFTFYKNVNRFKFLLMALLSFVVVFLVFNYSSNLYSDYFHSSFNLGDASYLFSAWTASLFLFFKNCIFGVGLGGFEDKLFSVKSFNFPLVISNPSNFYLLLLTEFGIIGVLLFAKPLFLLLKEKHRQFKLIPRLEIVDRRPLVPAYRFLLSIIMSAIISFSLIAIFNSVLITPFFLCFFALLITGLNLEVDTNSPAVDCPKKFFSQNFLIRRSSNCVRYYFLLTCFLAVLFSYDGYKVLRSQGLHDNASYDFEIILKEPEVSKYDDLLDALYLVELSIKQNRYNLDAWLLKHKILNEIYNKNPIRFHHYIESMFEASEFVLNNSRNYWCSWLRHGISLALVGNLKDAEEAFLQATMLAPNNFETNLYMGSFLMNHQESLENAGEYIEKALIIDPVNKEALALYQKLKL